MLGLVRWLGLARTTGHHAQEELRYVRCEFVGLFERREVATALKAREAAHVVCALQPGPRGTEYVPEARDASRHFDVPLP